MFSLLGAKTQSNVFTLNGGLKFPKNIARRGSKVGELGSS